MICRPNLNIARIMKVWRLEDGNRELFNQFSGMGIAAIGASAENEVRLVGNPYAHIWTLVREVVIGLTQGRMQVSSSSTRTAFRVLGDRTGLDTFTQWPTPPVWALTNRVNADGYPRKLRSREPQKRRREHPFPLRG
jgi:hypothetical protein